MIPLYARTGDKGLAPVTILLLLVNVGIFFYQLSLSPAEVEQWFYQFGFVPAELHQGAWEAALVSLGTCMYIHGGWSHLFGNMMFLWAFGPPLERRLGFAGMIVFYHLGGLLGSLTQYWIEPLSQIPMIGASGAISGLLGGFLVLYPGVKVSTLLIVVIYITVVHLPSWFLIGFWVLIQGFYGLVAFGAGEMGGVAWFAHLGGFAGGFVLMLKKKLTGLVRS